MKIGVFCSANNQIDADYFRLTEGWHVKGTPLCMEDAIVA